MNWMRLSFLAAATLLALGCGQRQARQAGAPQDLPAGDPYLLAAEPEGGKGVLQLRQNAADNESVVIVGRIGGSESPWVDGRAAFSIVDPSLLACNDREGDECQTPWDYCCETDRLPLATALVKIVDQAGQLVAVDARELLHLKELQTVVAQGTARRDDAGNLTILANRLFVKP